MSDKLRTDFTKAERNSVIAGLYDEFGDHEFSDELVLLECQDMWRKGCHCLETECCNQCEHCGLNDWEERNPEYKDDTLAQRLKALKAELRAKNRAKIEKSLSAKGYIKVQWKQWNDGELIESDVKLYQPGSKELKADIADAIENWKDMWCEYFVLPYINLNATRGKLLDLRTESGDEYEICEIVKD